MPKSLPQTSNLGFTDRVLAVVKGIKIGSTLSYKEVAIKAGNAKAVRAVGTIMAKNFRPDIPCHRVIKSDGTVGAYNRGGSEAKIKLLKKEGAFLKQTGN